MSLRSSPMKSLSPVRQKMRQAGLAVVIAVLAGFASPSGTASLVADGRRVVAVDQLPEGVGEMCELAPAGMSRTLYAALQQQATARVNQETPRGQVAARRPVRAIGDPYPNF